MFSTLSVGAAVMLVLRLDASIASEMPSDRATWRNRLSLGNRAELVDRLGQGNEDQFRRLKRHHHPALALGNRAYRPAP